MNLYGFNGKLPGTNDDYSSKCFALNGKFFDPDLPQEDLIETYKNAVENVEGGHVSTFH